MNMDYHIQALLDSDDDDDDKENKRNVAIGAVVGYYVDSISPKRRALFHVRDRMEWLRHLDNLHAEGNGAFRRLYRMNYDSFVRLLGIIRPAIQVDESMSTIRSSKGPIIPEIMLHCLLRWLSGGEHLNIRLVAGISKASFYRCIYKCIDAILAADELSFTFPSGEGISIAARQFRSISSNDAIHGCVACLDGFLMLIQTPSSKETGHVKSYFSGHYQTYGINIQAACDYRCRFVFVSVAAPGGVNDITAFRKTQLSRIIHTLPKGKFIIGNNAYVCSEHLLTPYSGDEKNDPRKDAYNFYISQLRIRIEQAFGFMVNKWRILRAPLQVNLQNAAKIFMCIARLHNFCINEGMDVTSRDDIREPVVTSIPSDVTLNSFEGNLV